MGEQPYFIIETRDALHENRILACIQDYFAKPLHGRRSLDLSELKSKLKFEARKLNLHELNKFGITHEEKITVWRELRAVNLIPPEEGSEARSETMGLAEESDNRRVTRDPDETPPKRTAFQRLRTIVIRIRDWHGTRQNDPDRGLMLRITQTREQNGHTNGATKEIKPETPNSKRFWVISAITILAAFVWLTRRILVHSANNGAEWFRLKTWAQHAPLVTPAQPVESRIYETEKAARAANAEAKRTLQAAQQRLGETEERGGQVSSIGTRIAQLEAETAKIQAREQEVRDRIAVLEAEREKQALAAAAAKHDKANQELAAMEGRLAALEQAKPVTVPKPTAAVAPPSTAVTTLAKAAENSSQAAKDVAEVNKKLKAENDRLRKQVRSEARHVNHSTVRRTPVIPSAKGVIVTAKISPEEAAILKTHPEKKVIKR